MSDQTLSNLLTRFITVYLMLPILGLGLILALYAGWKRLEGIRFQKRITVQNAARAVDSNLIGLSRDLQRSGLLIREKEHWDQLDLLNSLNVRTSFDRLLLISRHGHIAYTLNALDWRLPELNEIFSRAQLRYLSQVQVSKPYSLPDSDGLRLALLTSTPSGELLLGEVSMSRLHATVSRFVSSPQELVFLADGKGRVLAPGSGPGRSEAQALAGMEPGSARQGAASEFLLTENTVYSSAPIAIPSWTVGLSTPLNSLLVSFIQYVGLLLVAVLLTVLAVIRLLFKRMDQDIIQPVRRLQRSVAKLKNGEYPVLDEAAPGSPHFKEFDDLEFEFKSMIQILALREASLRQKTSEQELLLDNVPLHIWFMVDQETPGAVNKVRARFFGLKAKEAAYKNIKEVLDPDAASLEMETNRTVFQKKQALHFEKWHRNAQGEPRLLSVRKVPKLNDDGDVEFVICTAKDRTESWRYEQKLRELSTAVEQSPASIIITDAAGRIQYVNPSFCRLSGYSEDEVLGRSPALLKSGDKPKEEYAKLWETIASGKTWQGEFHNRARSGELYWVSTLISPIFDQEGAIAQYVTFQEDITAKKETEHELLRAKIEAESANEAKSQFLANISHEIRTPINGIIGMCRLLTDSELSEEQRVFAQTIASSAGSLLEIINQILDFSKIESGALELERTVFDLQGTVQQVLTMFDSQAREKAISLSLCIEPQIPRALIGDPLRLQQILMNLLGNALKFTESGSVTLQVSRQLIEDQSLLLKFEVLDTGPGVPESKRQEIFEPFVQADGSTTRKYGGTGLGLSICRQLVEIMGGQMGLDTTEGEGSKFWFTIRFGRGSCDAAPSPRPVDVQGLGALEEAAGEAAASEPTELLQPNSIFDPAPLKDKLGHDLEAIYEVLGLFVEDVHQRLRRLRQGLKARDNGLLEQEAFKLKGASANIGAEGLALTAGELEKAVLARDLDKAARLVDTFHDTFRMFQTAVHGVDAALAVDAEAKGVR